MRALYKAPTDTGVREIVVPNKLETLQKLVGGYIETLTACMDPKVIAICNEEGAIRDDIDFNCAIACEDAGGRFDCPIFGPILLVGEDGEDFTDCPISLMVANGMIR